MIILYSLLTFKEEITVKQLTSYNRVAGYFNKLFDLLNQRFFENELSRPTITIQSTPRAYGHFSMRDDTWGIRHWQQQRNQYRGRYARKTH